MGILSDIVKGLTGGQPKTAGPSPAFEIRIASDDGRGASVGHDYNPPTTRPDQVPDLPERPTDWPVLPRRPDELEGGVNTPYVSVDDRPYDRTTCPSCGVELQPLPKAKKKCPSCRQDIFVRSGPDNRRYLIAPNGIPAFQQMVNDYYQAQAHQRQDAMERAEASWDKQLKDLGFLTGDAWVDAVGESYRQPELAALMARWRTRPMQSEVYAVAMLRRDPKNAYDPNAIEVLIDGILVGYLSRWEAEDWQPLLRRMERAQRPAWLEATIVGGVPTPDGLIGSIGVQFRNAPEI